MQTKDGLVTLPPHCDEVACYGEGIERCYLAYDTRCKCDLFFDAHGQPLTYLSASQLLGWPYTEVRKRIDEARKPYDQARLQAAVNAYDRRITTLFEGVDFQLPSDWQFDKKLSSELCIGKHRVTEELMVFTVKGQLVSGFEVLPEPDPAKDIQLQNYTPLFPLPEGWRYMSLLSGTNHVVAQNMDTKEGGIFGPQGQLIANVPPLFIGVLDMKEPNDTVNTKVTIDQAGTRIDSDGPVSLGTLTAGERKASSLAVNQLTTRIDRFDGSATVSRIDSPVPGSVKQYTSENVTPEDLEVIRKEWALPDIESARVFIKQRDLERQRRETLEIANAEDTDATNAVRLSLKAIQLREELDKLTYGMIQEETKALAILFNEFDPAEIRKGMTTQAAVQHLCQALRDDPSYAWSWHCNIAMAMRDSGCDALVAQKGAALFLQILTMDENGKGLDIRTSEEYKGWMEQYHAAQNKPA